MDPLPPRLNEAAAGVAAAVVVVDPKGELLVAGAPNMELPKVAVVETALLGAARLFVLVVAPLLGQLAKVDATEVVVVPDPKTNGLDVVVGRASGFFSPPKLKTIGLAVVMELEVLTTLLDMLLVEVLTEMPKIWPTLVPVVTAGTEAAGAAGTAGPWPKKKAPGPVAGFPKAPLPKLKVDAGFGPVVAAGAGLALKVVVVEVAADVAALEKPPKLRAGLLLLVVLLAALEMAPDPKLKLGLAGGAEVVPVELDTTDEEAAAGAPKLNRAGAAVTALLVGVLVAFEVVGALNTNWLTGDGSTAAATGGGTETLLDSAGPAAGAGAGAGASLLSILKVTAFGCSTLPMPNEKAGFAGSCGFLPSATSLAAVA